VCRHGCGGFWPPSPNEPPDPPVEEPESSEVGNQVATGFEGTDVVTGDDGE